MNEGELLIFLVRNRPFSPTKSKSLESCEKRFRGPRSRRVWWRLKVSFACNMNEVELIGRNRPLSPRKSNSSESCEKHFRGPRSRPKRNPRAQFEHLSIVHSVKSRRMCVMCRSQSCKHYISPKFGSTA